MAKIISRFFANISVFIICIVVIIVAFIVFSLKLTTVSVDEDGWESSSLELKDSVKIYTNEHGIPHIIASNEDDLFFAMGYIHAKDRLWQMDIARRTAEGKLSEIFGKRTLLVDKFMRGLGIRDISDSVWKVSNKKSRMILESYANGVNQYISDNKDLSFEFGALDYKPDPWIPKNTLSISKLMSFELSVGFWIDITLGQISEKIGIDRAVDLITDYPEFAPHITDYLNSSELFTPKSNNNNNNQIVADYDNQFDEFAKNLYEIRNILSLKGSSIGSNSWAIKKNIAEKSSAILANDPHLNLSLPPKWYQIHLTSKYFNVVGLSVPGIPLCIIGRNNSIAWGITNVMMDDLDYFMEKIDPDNSDRYFRNDSISKEFVFRLDTINIKGSIPEIYYIKYTDISAVISDFHILNEPNQIFKNEKYSDNKKSKFFKQFCLTFKWAAEKKSDGIQALYQMNKSKNWSQFKLALQTWSSPALNFTYADIDGNVGICPAGTLPERQEKCNPVIPNPAWISGYQWNNYSSLNQLPNIYNPKKSFVFSANNKTSRNFNKYISNYWEPFSRAYRIENLLNQVVEYSVKNAQFMQYDVLSPYAEVFLGKCLPYLDNDRDRLDTTEILILDNMLRWDYIMNYGSFRSSIYNAFFERMVYNTYYDELGSELYDYYSIVSSVPTNKILSLLNDENNIWFDDVKTSKRETLGDIVKISFSEAILKLSAIFEGTKPGNWEYGQIHTVTFNHNFSENNLIRPTVTAGPYPIGGNHTTINNTEWRLYDPFKTVLGPSSRFICDLEDSVIYTNLPGGSSGDPLNPHYKDQMQLWLSGGYIKLNCKPEPDPADKLKYILLPN